MILDFVNFMVVLILPVTFVIMVLFNIRDIRCGRRNFYLLLKGLFCVFFTFAIAFAIIMRMVFDIYSVAVVMRDMDITYVVREIFFISVAFVWNVIGAGMVVGVWKLVYYHDYDFIRRFKNDWNKIKEGRKYGKYKETNKL